MKALITGATKGIGKAVAMELAAKGYDLALVARSLADLGALKQELSAVFPGREVLTLTADLSKRFETGVVAQSVNNHWGSIDVLVNNVGAYGTGSFLEEEDELLEELMRVNVYSAYRLSRAFVPAMVKREKGFVFNICSVLSKESRESAASYTITKFALLGMNKVLAESVREKGVRVTAILPGSVNTPSWDGLEAPKESFVQPEDVARLITTALELSDGAWMEEMTIRPAIKGY